MTATLISFDVDNCNKHFNLYKEKLVTYESNVNTKFKNDYCVHIWFILNEILKYYSNDVLTNYIQDFCQNLFHYIILDYTINIKLKYNFLVKVASLNKLFKKLLQRVRKLYKNIHLVSNIEYIQDIEYNRKACKYLDYCRETLVDFSIIYEIYSNYLKKRNIKMNNNKLLEKSLYYINCIYDIDHEDEKEYIEVKYKKYIISFDNLDDDTIILDNRHLEIILSYTKTNHCNRSMINTFLSIENEVFQ